MRAIALLYFVSHIPITLLIDGQALLPPSYFPSWAKQSLQWYISLSNDPLMSKARTSKEFAWFRGLIAIELTFQLPLFFALTYGFYARAQSTWVHVVNIIYAVHVMTTMVPIFASLAGWDRMDLVPVYAPYLLVPFYLALQSMRVIRQKLVKSNSKKE